jgi:hypothetical protein
VLPSIDLLGTPNQIVQNVGVAYISTSCTCHNVQHD